MRKLLLTSVFVLCSLGCFAQQDFFYRLSVKPTKDTQVRKLYVAYEMAGIKYVDSLSVQGKQPQLSKKLSQPVAATLYADLKSIPPQAVFLANNTVQVTVGEASLAVEKTKLQQDFLSLTENDMIRPKYYPLYAELNAKNDTAGLNKLAILFDSLKADDVAKSQAYLKINPSSLLSLFAFNRYTTTFTDFSEVEKDFELLPAWARNSPDGKNMQRKIQGAKSTKLGGKAIGFTQPSATGDRISLEDFKGKYVLLDFWASWCGPCRKEHPDFAQAYQEFQLKGFEIISISLDDKEKAWLTAITKDSMVWTNVSDLKGFQNEAALAYGIQAIPANFLIDPAGNIIARDLKGEALIAKLKALLAE